MIKNSKFNQNSKLKIQNFKLQSFPKILTIFFLAVFIFQLGCAVVLLTLPRTSRAAEINYTPLVNIPGYTFNKSDPSTDNIANLVQAIYKYAIGVVGILAAIVLMVGGVLWIVAGGNATRVGEAKAWIGAALTGLVLALTSYLILNTVNPALVNFKTTNIPGVEKKFTNGLGSCTITPPVGRPYCVEDYNEKICLEKKGDFKPGEECIFSCCQWKVGGVWSGYRRICIRGTPKGDCELINDYEVYEPDGKCEKNGLDYLCKKK